MVKLTDTIDLVRRRTNGCLGSDGVDTVYIVFDENKEHAQLVFILKDDIPTADITKLAVRYQHLFSDHLDFYSLRVLPATNYFSKNQNTYSIWQCSNNFEL